jgi:hypothetical protein
MEQMVLDMFLNIIVQLRYQKYWKFYKVFPQHFFTLFFGTKI